MTLASARSRRLAIVAPRALGQRIAAALPRAVATMLVERPAPGRARGDPYGVSRTLKGLRDAPDAVLLVASRRRSPARLVPGPLVDGVPVGIVQADREADLDPWLKGLDAQAHGLRAWATLAMGQDFYLDLARMLIDRMRGAIHPSRPAVENWCADRIGRSDLCLAMARGPRLACYLGHGRTRGWSGYQAVRWSHVAAAPASAPCGLVVGFTCDTLSYARDASPFGCMWVREGRAAAYLGCTEAVRTDLGARLVQEFGAALAACEDVDVATLLRALDRRLIETAGLAPVREVFATFRLVGYPLIALH